jgi:hypothetical protein
MEPGLNALLALYQGQMDANKENEGNHLAGVAYALSPWLGIGNAQQLQKGIKKATPMADLLAGIKGDQQASGQQSLFDYLKGAGGVSPGATTVMGSHGAQPSSMIQPKGASVYDNINLDSILNKPDFISGSRGREMA